jgi:hypothetical protein
MVVVSSFFALAQESQSRPSAETKPSGYDLRLSSKARALIVDVTHTGKGRVTVKRGAVDLSQPVEYKVQARWLDELGALDPKFVEDRRTFIEVRVNEGASNKDPGVDGVTLIYTSDDGKFSVRPEKGRRVLQKELESQLRQLDATGLFLRLPEDVAIGSKIPLRNAALVATVLSLDGELEGFSGAVVLDRVDPKTNRAYLSGSVRVTQVSTKEESVMASTFDGLLTLEVDLATHEMAQVALSGTAKMSGRGDLEGSVSGEIKFEAKATTKPATDVAAIKAKKPSFRDNTHKFEGVEFKMPACWLALNAQKPDIRSFLDSRVEADLVIEVARLSQQADPAEDGFVKGFADVVKKDDANAKVVKTSFPTGKGLMFELTNDDGVFFKGAVAPLGKTLVRVRMYGPSELVKKAESDLKTLLNSLKAAP